jgi:hypothetical protein
MNYGDSMPIHTLDMVWSMRDPALGRLKLEKRVQGRPYERRPSWLITLVQIMNTKVPWYDQVSRARRMFTHEMVKWWTPSETQRLIRELRQEEQVDKLVNSTPNFILVDYQEPIQKEVKWRTQDKFDELIKLYAENPTKAYEYAYKEGLLSTLKKTS